MKFTELNPPVIELPENLQLHRVQRIEAPPNSVRLNGHVLAPAGLLTGRFDLSDESITYLADSEFTALYESLLRREIHSCSIELLRERLLASFRSLTRLRVADLRGLEEQYPVLQSARYAITQRFAADCRKRGLDGILYASAQHPTHACLCLFESGIRKLRRISATPLVKPGTRQLHWAVVNALNGSRIALHA